MIAAFYYFAGVGDFELVPHFRYSYGVYYPASG